MRNRQTTKHNDRHGKNLVEILWKCTNRSHFLTVAVYVLEGISSLKLILMRVSGSINSMNRYHEVHGARRFKLNYYSSFRYNR